MTIYRFIVEEKHSGSGSGRKPKDTTNKGAAKKGRQVSFFGGDKGGVEHNRKMRALNPLFNRATGGAWEKSVRGVRAGIGMVKSVQKNGAKGVFSGPALYILFAMLLKFGMDMLKAQQKQAQKENMQNFKQLENGIGAVHGEYKVSTNILTGRHTYNQNK